MRHFTARYLEAVGIGNAVVEDIVLGELARPNLTTVVVDECPGWITSPNLDTAVNDIIVGRAAATMLVPFTWDNVGQHKQAMEKTPLSERGFIWRRPTWLRLDIDTPFLIEDRKLKFTISRQGSGSQSATVGWQVAVRLMDGSEFILSGTAEIPEGEDSVQVEIDFNEISLPLTNYASVELYWSWGIPLSPSRRGTVIEVSEDAPFFTRSLIYEPWLYWGNLVTGGDLSGNGRAGSGGLFAHEHDILAGAPGCYGSAIRTSSGSFFFSQNPYSFLEPLSEYSISMVFRITEEVGTQHRILCRAAGVQFHVAHNGLELKMDWPGVQETITGVSLGSWNHLVITFDGSTFGGYLNGTEMLFHSQPTPSPSSYFALGGGPSSTRDLNDFAIWDRVLSQGEVQFMYAGLT